MRPWHIRWLTNPVIFIFLEWVEPTRLVFVTMLVVCSAEDLNLSLLTCPTSYLPTIPRCYQYLLGNQPHTNPLLRAACISTLSWRTFWNLKYFKCSMWSSDTFSKIFKHQIYLLQTCHFTVHIKLLTIDGAGYSEPASPGAHTFTGVYTLLQEEEKTSSTGRDDQPYR